MSKIEDLIWPIAEPVAQESGMELIEVEYVKEGSDWYLRLYIDKEDGAVDLDDCERVSRRMSDVLDDRDPIENAYRLEVSSPGLERPLKRDKDFLRFKGEKIRVKTFAPVEGQKEFVGHLGDVEAERLEIITGGQPLWLPREKISRVNLEFEF